MALVPALVPEDNENKEEEDDQTILYRTYNFIKKVDWFEWKNIETALEPMLQKFESLRR